MCATLAVASLACVDAEATIVTYDFTANVDKMSVVDPSTSTNVDVTSSDIPGALISMGDRIQGSFFYDTTAPLVALRFNNTWAQYFSASQPVGGIQLTMSNGLSYNSSFYSHLDVVNDGPFAEYSDHFGVATSIVSSSMFEQIGFNQSSITSDFLANTNIPVSLKLDPAIQTDIEFSWLRSSDLKTLRFDANVASLTPHAADLPEPASALLMMIGLGALVAFGSQKRRA
jgi:hypothetical protein